MVFLVLTLEVKAYWDTFSARRSSHICLKCLKHQQMLMSVFCSSLKQNEKVLHFFFFFLFPLLLLWCSRSSALWLLLSCFWSLDHSLCSCWSKSGVNSPSLTRRLARELSIICPEALCPLWPLLPVKKCVLPVPLPVWPCLLLCACSGSVTVVSEALMSRVIFRTPCWMISSSSRWISLIEAVSGNMSMKR